LSPSSSTVRAAAAVVAALREMAQRLALRGGTDVFRARAHERAARVVEGRDDLARLVAERRLSELPGIGDALAATITEVYQTGSSRRLSQLQAERPAAVVALAPIVGLKTAERLRSALHLEGLEDLRRACVEGRVRTVPGFGARREAQILAKLAAAITPTPTAPPLLRLHLALDEAARLVAHLRRSAAVAVDLVGEARRGHELVDRIELVAGVAAEARESVLAHFERYPPLLSTRREGDSVSGRLSNGAAVHLRTVAPRDYGRALVADTGSSHHVARLEERFGPLPADRATEDEIYLGLGLPVVPPEIREGAGEIEAAVAGRLPRLVTREDVRGAVHCHTTASDGRHSLIAMARAAEACGFQYMTVTDHSPTAHYARGLDLDRLHRQWDEIAAVQETVGIRLLRGTECDITADGALDWPDAVIERLDVVIASIHQRYRLDEGAMTARVVRAMRHPAFKIWGHPLGRLVGRRPPIPCRIDEILDALAESRGAIEINGDPHRLDLPPRLVPGAAARGIPFVIGSDAHATGELDNVRYGVIMARRGWLTADQVLNTRDAGAFADAVKPARVRT
jgi:DNA polymerase (family X)